MRDGRTNMIVSVNDLFIYRGGHSCHKAIFIFFAPVTDAEAHMHSAHSPLYEHMHAYPMNTSESQASILTRQLSTTVNGLPLSMINKGI